MVPAVYYIRNEGMDPSTDGDDIMARKNTPPVTNVLDAYGRAYTLIDGFWHAANGSVVEHFEALHRDLNRRAIVVALSGAPTMIWGDYKEWALMAGVPFGPDDGSWD